MGTNIPWIRVSKDSPYFVDESGNDWTPIGFNDCMSWPNLAGLIDRKDVPSAERYLKMISRKKINCLRLMMEDCDAGLLLETKVGEFNPLVVQFWDDMFRLCSKYKIRLLIAPYDTFWMWLNWLRHPYNRRNGGPCKSVRTLLIEPQTRSAIKNRFKFFTERWGKTGTVFAWDLWNEIHPAYTNDQTDIFDDYIKDVGGYIKKLETKIHGRAHLQTISVFGPLLIEGFMPYGSKVHLRDNKLAGCVFANRNLDFANAHTYEDGTIDDPKDTVRPALAMGFLTEKAILQIRDDRPYFDSEYGPIHTFKDHKRTLPDSFDTEYFRHCSWAHLASGAAGGGMRWPNRHPHVLTKGMYEALFNMQKFLRFIDWQNFERRVINKMVDISSSRVSAFGCASKEQAVLWLIRSDSLNYKGMLSQITRPAEVAVGIPDMREGIYKVTLWNTLHGKIVDQYEIEKAKREEYLALSLKVVSDLAVAVMRL